MYFCCLWGLDNLFDFFKCLVEHNRYLGNLHRSKHDMFTALSRISMYVRHGKKYLCHEEFYAQL